ncbi:MAG: TonB-dependent receptor, partial [Microvirgula sp.]
MASSGPFPTFTLSPLALGLLLLPSFAHADSDTVLETVTVSSEQPLADPRLPEVTTATRTRTPARYIPQAIDAVAVKNLDAYGQTDLSQALTGVPGVDASGDTRFDSVSIRGFSAANDLYLDGFRDDMQYSRDLGNIERVEVLKGPAAVLYGRGSSGGIVNRVSKKPQPGLPSSVSARVGSEGLWRLQADLNGSLSDDITVRLNAAQEESDSFRGDALHSRRQLFAPSLNWRLTPALNWLVQYEYGLYDRTPDRGIPGINGRPADGPLDTVYGNAARDYIRDETQSLRSRLSYDLNEHWQLRHLLGVIRLNSDFDNTYQTGVSGNRVTRQRWIQDLNALNITNNFEAEGQFTTGPLAHQLLAGVEIG